VSITEIMRRGRLGWFGHLERKGSDDWVSNCINFWVPGPKSKGRSKKTWDECVRHGLRSGGLNSKWTQNKTLEEHDCGKVVQLVHAWRSGRFMKANVETDVKRW